MGEDGLLLNINAPSLAMYSHSALIYSIVRLRPLPRHNGHTLVATFKLNQR